MPLLQVDDLQKGFISPDGSPHLVIDVPSFGLEAQAEVALAGPSGTGKSTFLHLIAGILKPDAGSVTLAGRRLSALPEAQRDRVRARSIGYIFQTFNLLPAFTVLENILLAMSFGPGANRARAETVLHRVGLSHRLHHRPHQLSTGQQQRVAVARALVNQPVLVLADEPTGNLDQVNARDALQLIRDATRETKAALLLVSHDPAVLAQFHPVIQLAAINRAAAPSPAPP